MKRFAMTRIKCDGYPGRNCRRNIRGNLTKLINNFTKTPPLVVTANDTQFALRMKTERANGVAEANKIRLGRTSECPLQTHRQPHFERRYLGILPQRPPIGRCQKMGQFLEDDLGYCKIPEKCILTE